MNNKETKIIEEIESSIKNKIPLSIKKVKKWMRASDREVQGAIFEILFDNFEMLESPLTFKETNYFFLNYLERCLRENVEGKYSFGRYLAADALRAWFQRLWEEKEGHSQKTIMKKIKDMLAHLCYEEDMKINDAIITGILEHLFINKNIVNFFHEWEGDPKLSIIYHEALYLSSENN